MRRARRDRDMTLAAMTAAASQLDNAAPDDVEITDSSAAAEYIADGCLVDGPLGRVGLEMEAHCFDPADPFRRPSWEEITEVLEWLSPLPGGSVVSVEPGGAVELSGPPADGVLAAIGAMTRDQAVLRSALANAGLGLVFLGADPLRSPVRVNPGARYRAMEQFFAASHSGVPGAAMMTSTAAIQVNLDAGPQEGWAERVRLAHALGPTMIAIAANSRCWAAGFPAGSPPGSGCGARWTPRAAAPFLVPVATTPASTGLSMP